MFYNLYLSGAGLKRNVIATDYAINILETVQSTEYDLVKFENEGTLKSKLDTLIDPTNKYTSTINDNIYNIIASGYNITVKIEKYSDKFTNGEKEDYIKIITVSIEYSLGKNEDESSNLEKLEIKTLKTIQ